MQPTTPERIVRDVAALADRDLRPEDYRRAVLDRVVMAIPAVAGCVSSADPGSLALVAHTSQGIDRRGADRLGPHVARGLRDALLRDVPTLVPAARAPAVWVLDRDCRLVQATPGSESVLAALRDDETPADETPEVLVGLAVMARAAAGRASSGTTPEVPRLQVPTTNGDWLTLHASVLLAVDGTAGQVVITSIAAGAADLLDLSLLAFRLTPAERAAVVLVLAGRSTKQIAEELVLSPHTVQDRMQDVFAKVGVRSRRELVAKLGA